MMIVIKNSETWKTWNSFPTSIIPKVLEIEKCSISARSAMIFIRQQYYIYIEEERKKRYSR